jgi:hypothetical protein
MSNQPELGNNVQDEKLEPKKKPWSWSRVVGMNDPQKIPCFRKSMLHGFLAGFVLFVVARAAKSTQFINSRSS